MLVLRRRQGEAIRIGDDIKVVVVQSAGWVRLGVEAPPDVSVWREEIYERKQGEEDGRP